MLEVYVRRWAAPYRAHLQAWQEHMTAEWCPSGDFFESLDRWRQASNDPKGLGWRAHAILPPDMAKRLELRWPDGCLTDRVSVTRRQA
jgi:hypothetical protein